jgi:Protein of unknown function (DUF2384)
MRHKIWRELWLDLLHRSFVAGAFSPDLIAELLRTTKEEIATTAGLSRDAVARKARVHARGTQMRLRELMEILNRVEPWAGSPLAAYAWYRSQPLPGFAGRTAEMLVREGKAAAVRAYLDEVALGGFA